LSRDGAGNKCYPITIRVPVDLASLNVHESNSQRARNGCDRSGLLYLVVDRRCRLPVRLIAARDRPNCAAMIDEFELFRARAYGLRDDSDSDRRHDVIGEKSADDVTSGSSHRRTCWRRWLQLRFCFESTSVRRSFDVDSQSNVSRTTAPCGLRGCKNRPAPFPGRMS